VGLRPESPRLGNEEQRRPAGTCNGRGSIGEAEKDRGRAVLDLGWEGNDKWVQCAIEWTEGD
jgi:hypothetical protein